MRRALRLLLGLQTVRHIAILFNTAHSARWLSQPDRRAPSDGRAPRIAVVLPLLRERSAIAAAVEHFESLLREGDRLVLVTTAMDRGDTPQMASRLADGERVRHIHLADERGCKADQINFAVHALADEDVGKRVGLVVVYDADSRPRTDSLELFAAEAARNPGVAVFHQSARFEVRRAPRRAFDRALAHAGALRANRFVLAYELPRLRARHPAVRGIRRRIAAATYGHVSGHGLGLRLGFLRDRPMPAHTAMEDMHYSYDLAVEGTPVIPLRSLDRSEVPVPWQAQFAQAVRWFAGPGRAVAYLRGCACEDRGAAPAVTTSALLISLEWLSCLPALPVLLLLLRGSLLERRLSSAFLMIYAAQLAVVSATAGPISPRDRIMGLLAFPLLNAGFGTAGFVALLGRGFDLVDKTER